MEVLQEFVGVQHAHCHHEGGPRAYASRPVSSSGQKDGLYWPSENGNDASSPIGALLAHAFVTGATLGDSEPYHGYYYRVLDRQGKSAPGGEMTFMDDRGLMTKGFSVIAWPANYGNSGITTFGVNHCGIVFEKDLGPATEEIVTKLTAFDPDDTWAPARP
jgi:hypothetical protein